MKLERSCGILLHISSLPGRYGTGTLGPEAYEFAELLHAGGQSYWQVLPIGPVAPALGYSPYASTSTFAGNPLFISLEKLAGSAGLHGDIDTAVFPDSDFCDFDAAAGISCRFCARPAKAFLQHAAPAELNDFAAFCAEAACWLDDYALFAALGRSLRHQSLAFMGQGHCPQTPRRHRKLARQGCSLPCDSTVFCNIFFSGSGWS